MTFFQDLVQLFLSYIWNPFVFWIFPYYITEQVSSRSLEPKRIQNYFPTWNDWTIVTSFEHPIVDITDSRLFMEEHYRRKIERDLKRYRDKKSSAKSVYFVYGPPRTGKFTLTATIANTLRFDIYHLVFSNGISDIDLIPLLMKIKDNSILLVQNFDRLPQIHDLITFIDNLWTCCGGQRLIVLTTTTDLIQLQTWGLAELGRFDLSIHMGYFLSSNFRRLVTSFDPCFAFNNDVEEIEKLLEEVDISHGEVVAALRDAEDVDSGIRDFYEVLLKTLKKLQEEGEQQLE